MLKDITSEKVLNPVNKYMMAFIVLSLITANVYQYVDGEKRDAKKDAVIEKLNQDIRVMNEKSYAVEQERALRYEYLLNTLPKITTDVPQKKSNR